jgi:uncharacterized protein (TIRG00374 family)
MSEPRRQKFLIPSAPPSLPKGTRVKALRLAGIFLLIALLYPALRNAPLIEIWAALRRLQLWQILAILCIDTIIYAFVTARWWFIVNADNKHIKYLPLIPVRISVFGISYFTLGPQVGGEPLQVLYLQRAHGLTYTRAASTVVVDKLVEFLANFVLLAFGLTAIIEAGIFSKNGSPPPLSLIGLTALVAWPLIHIVLLYNKIYPLSAFLRALPAIPQDSKLIRFLRASEHLAGRFCQRHPRSLCAAIFVSLLAAIGMVGEYALITASMQVGLHFWQTAAAWTAGWLSFLAPLPGGLGALEASQVFALGMFGYAAPAAISVVLLMRGRDLLIGSLGLILAGHRIGR